MAVMTERDRKKAAKKSALRIGGIITIVLMYLCGYAGGIMQDEHLETGQAMIMAMERISTFHLFFPLNQLAFTVMLDFEVKRIENNMMRDMLTTENISILSPKSRLKQQTPI